MQGSIVLVPFPFDDLSSSKVRPALCLTEPVGPHRHVIVAFITSREPDDPLASDVTIGVADADFGATGFKVTSTIRLHRLVTIPAQLLQRQLGALTPRQWQAIQLRLADLFGWSPARAEDNSRPPSPARSPRD